MGSASTAWKVIRPALEEKFQVTAIDLPGHGKSDFDPNQAMDPYSLALLITKQMDELGIEKAHIAGNSLGGWIALELGAAFPDRVLSITGLAPAGLWLCQQLIARCSAQLRELWRNTPINLQIK